MKFAFEMVPIEETSRSLYPQLIALDNVVDEGRNEERGRARGGNKGRMTAQGAMTLRAHSARSFEGSRRLQPLTTILVSIKLPTREHRERIARSMSKSQCLYIFNRPISLIT